ARGAGELITMTSACFDLDFAYICGRIAFTAAVLGGIGSLPGALLGCILVDNSDAHVDYMDN
ncbi:branched-chain amino acid ABC transporter permease LivH, partial [Serratia liquefaciens]